MLNILISNDDGIHSNGLYKLAKGISRLGKVTVVAPDKEQSAIGHAITIHQPLRCRRVNLNNSSIEAYWVNGTPADCIKIGVETILTERPDLIISGINDGENVGTDILYSGTVSAAIEGSIFGIPSIAVSYAKYGETDFSLASEAAYDVIKRILELAGGTGILLNINIPEIKNKSELKGIKITRLGVKKYKNSFKEFKDPRGNSYYWLAGDLVNNKIEEDTDIYAVRNGFISITPLNIDLTGYKEIGILESWGIMQNYHP